MTRCAPLWGLGEKPLTVAYMKPDRHPLQILEEDRLAGALWSGSISSFLKMELFLPEPAPPVRPHPGRAAGH